MNDYQKYIVCVFLLICISSSGHARDKSNSISLTNRTSPTIKLAETIVPGKATGIVMEDTQWINYDVELNPMESYKSISAFVASGDIPPGVEIYAEVSHDNGLGHGQTGRPLGKIKLSNVPAVIIHEIGTSNTGNGKFHGHKVTLYTVVTDYSQIQSGDFNFYIQYTLN